ncbi:hypothetical protein QTQ03_28610 [Micromonospora sp. WMMA1363]|uniref:hypothetical protein n=1 Tax=Micromonospora sp. WMMA1363 TaxID=3053985 RepID=UPI00259D2EC8|nr:hypothetical protein [Micromonospora sp. WMMA1363]MDM4723276.1 hypothetical protein [Micromonospora sp. WMMA1363]MDM4723370.1 hypothetical protein [Micromonospora sp. WMMA1363]
MRVEGPLERWCEETCGICPAQLLAPGRFDVVARPARELAFNQRLGWRATPSGTPVCVHPYRVGMPPGAYASAREPLPDLAHLQVLEPPQEALVLPDSLDDLSAWMVAHLRTTGPDRIFTVVARLERIAGERFAPGEVVKILRRVLSVEMARV